VFDEVADLGAEVVMAVFRSDDQRLAELGFLFLPGAPIWLALAFLWACPMELFAFALPLFAASPFIGGLLLLNRAWAFAVKEKGWARAARFVLWAAFSASIAWAGLVLVGLYAPFNAKPGWLY
jgi:hypothetical protein